MLLVGAWILLALDLARVRTVLDESRRPLRNWLWALLCVGKHPVATFGLLAAMAGLFIAVAAVYSAIAGTLPPSVWAAALAAVVLQQTVVFLRSALRIGLVGGELAFCAHTLPPPATAVPVLEPEPVVSGSPAATTEDAGPRDGVETPGTAPAEPPGETAASPGN